VGAREISRDSMVGFQSGDDALLDYREIKASAMNELKRFFRPEFVNRVDEIVVFHSLSRDHVRSILEFELAEVQTRLVEKELILEVKRSAKDYLIDQGYEAKYGARPLRRTIQREIEDPLAMEILKGRFELGDHIVVYLRNGSIAFRQGPRKKEDKTLELAASGAGNTH
jgi:ATP-dependent Clp protease ATP-binding subunit ClpC